ncbi:hypothetical protein CP02DC21_1742 [Chlamydia psittaci 02DC21]|nr:hypothetical protein CP02DC21_1742 [Chlamydia psittaci 02DC21]
MFLIKIFDGTIFLATASFKVASHCVAVGSEKFLGTIVP